MVAERDTELKSVLFPVELQTIFIRQEGVVDPALWDKGKKAVDYQLVPRFKAIVDLERNYTFAVVSEKYRLVENAEAVELCRQCFRQVFSQKTAEGMEVFNIIMPKTRSFCHVDFIHKGHTVEPWGGNKWWPFLRMTNSYNRTKPLRFDVGFCRSICMNGVIFGRQHIEFRYYHTHDRIGVEGQSQIKFRKLKELETQFIEQMHNLKRYYVPQEHMLALLCMALNIQINPNDLNDEKKRERLIQFRDTVTRLTEKYFSELGPNGYAALNVITDFASRPMLYISWASMVDPLQKRSGDWVTGFINAIEKPGFDFTEYLDQFGQRAQALSA